MEEQSSRDALPYLVMRKARDSFFYWKDFQMISLPFICDTVIGECSFFVSLWSHEFFVVLPC